MRAKNFTGDLMTLLQVLSREGREFTDHTPRKYTGKGKRKVGDLVSTFSSHFIKM